MNTLNKILVNYWYWFLLIILVIWGGNIFYANFRFENGMIAYRTYPAHSYCLGKSPDFHVYSVAFAAKKPFEVKPFYRKTKITHTNIANKTDENGSKIEMPSLDHETGSKSISEDGKVKISTYDYLLKRTDDGVIIGPSGRVVPLGDSEVIDSAEIDDIISASIETRESTLPLCKSRFSFLDFTYKCRLYTIVVGNGAVYVSDKRLTAKEIMSDEFIKKQCKHISDSEKDESVRWFFPNPGQRVNIASGTGIGIGDGIVLSGPDNHDFNLYKNPENESYNLTFYPYHIDEKMNVPE